MTVQPAQLPAISQEVIFLDPDDDLATVRAKLESTTADEVYLVVPKRASILRTPLEFRILSRLVHALSSDTIIVTGDGGRRALARQEGLRTKRSLRSVAHLSSPPGSRRWALPTIPDWVPLPSFTGLLLLSLVTAVAGVIVFGVLPIMRVSVAARTVSAQRDYEILVDPSTRQIDIARHIVPGETLVQQVKVQGTVPATGVRRIGRERANGEVLFIGRQAQPATVPRGTILKTNNNLRFQTDQEVTVPANGEARVGITAVEPGLGGNVDARQITSFETPTPPPDAPPGTPSFQNITVRNDQPTRGGQDREVRIGTADDQAKLRDELQNRAREQGLAELYARAGFERSLIQQSLRLRPEGEEFQPGVDAEADQVSGTLSLAATAVVFANAEFNGLIRQIFLAEAGFGFDLPMSQLGVGTPQTLGVQDQRVRLKTSSEATLVRQVSADEIAQELQGKSTSEARSLLARNTDLDGSPSIEISPTWAPRAYRVEVAVAAPR